MQEVSMNTISFEDADFKIRIGGNPGTVQKAYHEDLEIKYYVEGISSLLINKKIIFAQTSDITFVNPYEIHSNIPIHQGENGTYYSLMIGLDFFAPLGGPHLDLRKLFISEGKRVKNHIRGNVRVQQTVLRIIEEMKAKEEHYQLVVRGLVEELFVLLLRGELAQEDGERETEERKRIAAIMPALSKIYADYAKEITVDELAALCNVSKYHFCRIFKKTMDKTAVQYIISYRIDLAEMLLKTTDDNIGEIAWRCGFRDESYFYRCYKKEKGVSPNTVRKSLRNT